MAWIITLIVALGALALFLWQRAQHTQALQRSTQLAAAEQTRLNNEHKQQMERLEREREREQAQGHLKFADSLLPGLDALFKAEDLAMDERIDCPKSLRDGLNMVRSEFERALHANGIERINPEQGATFDPAVHEAVSTATLENQPNNTIAQTLRAGWSHSTRVLRPTMVQVNKVTSSTKATPEDVTFDFEQDAKKKEHAAEQDASVSSS